MPDAKIPLLVLALASVSIAVAQGENPTRPPAPTPPAAAVRLSDPETKFIQDAVEAGRREITIARMGTQQGSSAAVKSFAERLVADHTAANTKLEEIARKNDVLMPIAGAATLSSTAVREQQNSSEPQVAAAVAGASKSPDPAVLRPGDGDISSLKGAEFDDAFVKLMIENHQKSIAEYEAFEKRANNAELKSFVAATLPTLREHLKAAQAITSGK